MPSFDVVSEVDLQEVRNAVDQAGREVHQRFDFKGTDSKVELNGHTVELESATDDRLDALRVVLEEKLVRRKVSLKAVSYGPVQEATKGRARQEATINAGIDQDRAREIGKFLKANGPKGISHQVQGDQLRVQGKKRDDLQDAIQSMREHDFGIPLQFKNFRD
jgi:uncharacterized protein YajQ (UPF0234 family)